MTPPSFRQNVALSIDLVVDLLTHHEDEDADLVSPEVFADVLEQASAAFVAKVAADLATSFWVWSIRWP